MADLYNWRATVSFHPDASPSYLNLVAYSWEDAMWTLDRHKIDSPMILGLVRSNRVEPLEDEQEEQDG